MDKEEYRENIYKLLHSYSGTYNNLVCVEELAELQKAVIKMERLYGREDAGEKGWHDEFDFAYSDLIEEMADVVICFDILKDMYNINDKMVEEEVVRKMQRNLARLE